MSTTYTAKQGGKNGNHGSSNSNSNSGRNGNSNGKGKQGKRSTVGRLTRLIKRGEKRPEPKGESEAVSFWRERTASLEDRVRSAGNNGKGLKPSDVAYWGQDNVEYTTTHEDARNASRMPEKARSIWDKIRQNKGTLADKVADLVKTPFYVLENGWYFLTGARKVKRINERYLNKYYYPGETVVVAFNGRWQNAPASLGKMQKEFDKYGLPFIALSLPWQMSIEDCVKYMEQKVEEVRKAVGQNAKIVLFGHSQGGETVFAYNAQKHQGRYVYETIMSAGMPKGTSVEDLGWVDRLLLAGGVPYSMTSANMSQYYRRAKNQFFKTISGEYDDLVPAKATHMPNGQNITVMTGHFGEIMGDGIYATMALSRSPEPYDTVPRAKKPTEFLPELNRIPDMHVGMHDEYRKAA